jgi:ProP effector
MKNRAALTLLAERFPQTFPADPKQRRPLKVGIADDLAAALGGVISRRQLAFALAGYCDSVAYLKNCTIGAERVDLAGNAVGTVTATQAAHASAKLVAKEKAKKAATKPQPPPAEAPPKKLSLADLRNAALVRREAAS